MTTILLLGTLDTKGNEYKYVKEKIEAEGCRVITVDVGIKGVPAWKPDISREQVAAAAGYDLSALVRRNDRGFAIQCMAEGAAAIVRSRYDEGDLQAILALGGSGGSTIAASAMRALPIGVPKLLVSTIASGDTSHYVGQADITMMYSVVDIAGINSISEPILTNAAAAICGMAKARVSKGNLASVKPMVAVTMFGVTTQCVTKAKERLEAHGYEVVVFHANGSGGKAMEALIRDGFFCGVLDTTTTELADELVGGLLSAGPDRLEIAGRMGIPQVVSLGALDMVNFGPPDTIPSKFEGRKFYKHNPHVTLMRTTAEENDRLGRIIGRKLNQAKGPAAVFIPRKGISSIAKENEVFYDPDADRALIESLRNELDSHVEWIDMDTDINHPRFAEAMADKLDELIKEKREVRSIE
jgi:uncharacterized protein (UPF0261 family)